MTMQELPISISEPEKRTELLRRNSDVWEKKYLKGDFAGAKQEADGLYITANEWNAAPDVLASILVTRSWSEYFIDKNGTTKTNTSYNSAKEGLTKLKDLEETPAIHALRSRLFEVAGLSQAYLIGEVDEPAEPLFRESVEEAEKSEVAERIGEAKNGFALWFISPKQKRFAEAIPLFQDVAKSQEEVGNKRTAGHAHNNLVVCHNETGNFDTAIQEADKALDLYEDPQLNHSFSARFRKSVSLRRLGRFEEALEIYELHKRFRSEDSKLSEQERARLIANEDKNIEVTIEESQNYAAS